jgi:hypothetical protein
MITGGGWVFVAGGGRVMGCGCCGVWSVELVVLQWFSSQRAAITHRRDMEALDDDASAASSTRQTLRLLHSALSPAIYVLFSLTSHESRALSHMSLIFTSIYLLSLVSSGQYQTESDLTPSSSTSLLQSRRQAAAAVVCRYT